MQITVLGAGSFGTCLALLLQRQGYDVTLWVRTPARCEAMRAARENETYLPGFALPEGLRLTSDRAEALEGAQMVLVVVPSQTVRDNMQQFAPHLPQGVPIICASKGIEQGTLLTMHEVLGEVLPAPFHDHIGVISGPSFAKEVAAGVPTAAVIATTDEALAKQVQEIFSDSTFRAYHTTDMVGVEFGGALKNVVAIAAGIVDGLGVGHNSRAAVITRGLAEISRLAVKRGANPLTLSGLSGMGDLVLTCTGGLSRNRRVGMALGEGRKLQEILDEMQMVAEGVKTTRSAYDLAQREGVEMPIVTEVYQVLYEDKSPKDAVRALMTRRLKHELS